MKKISMRARNVRIVYLLYYMRVVIDRRFGIYSTQGAWAWRAAWTPRGFDAINFLPP